MKTIRGIAATAHVRHSHNLNKRGATLIEVMMAGAIGLIVILGVNSAVNKANLNVKAIEQKNELRELEDLLKMAGTTEVQCQAIFAGSGVNYAADDFNVNGENTATQTLTRIVIPNKGNQVIQPGDPNLQYIVPGLRVTALTLERPGTTLGSTSYQGWLRIEAEREEGRKVNKAIAVRLLSRIPVNLIDSNSNGMANSCLIGASNNEQIKTELVVAPAGPADCTGDTGSHIQDCVNLAAASNPARGVLVKAGTYAVSTPISMPANTSIRGEPGAVLAGTGGVRILDINSTANSDHISIKGLTFNQNAQTGIQPAILVSAFGGRTFRNITIEGNHFVNTTNGASTTGIILSAAASSAIFRTQIIGNNFGGYLGTAERYKARQVIHLTSNDGTVSGTLIDNNRIDSHESDTSAGATLLLTSYGTGTLQDTQITNNTLVNSVGRAVHYNCPSGNCTNGVIEHLKITNNYRISSNGTSPTIELSGNTNHLCNFEISNNSITSIGASDGIRIAGFANTSNVCVDDNTINSNHIRGSGGTTVGISTTTRIRTISDNKIRSYSIGILDTHTSSGYQYRPRITKNIIHPEYIGISSSPASGVYIAENDIQSAYVGIQLTAQDSEVYDNIITTTGSNSAHASAQCGGTPRIVGLCLNATRAAVKGNTVRVLSSLATARGVLCTPGSNNSSFISNSRFFDSANALMSAATAIDPSCTPYLTHSENSDGGMSIRSGGNINVSGTGGINVGTGAATASKISVDGETVPSGCRQSQDTTGSRTVASNAVGVDTVSLCTGTGERVFSCGCAALVNGLVLTGCIPAAGTTSCVIYTRNVTGASVTGSSVVRALCCKE